MSGASTGVSLRCTWGAKRTAWSSACCSAPASTIHASASTPCAQLEKRSVLRCASPSMCMSCTAVTASSGSASHTFSSISSSVDARFSAYARTSDAIGGDGGAWSSTLSPWRASASARLVPTMPAPRTHTSICSFGPIGPL